MNEEVLRRLDAIAAELGVVSEHLWEVCVRQAMLEGVVGLVSASVGCTVCIVLARWLYPKLKEADYADQIPIGLALCLVSLGAAHTGHAAFTFVKYVLNPEFYAAKFILNAISG
jgi:hypothetical protein